MKSTIALASAGALLLLASQIVIIAAPALAQSYEVEQGSPIRMIWTQSIPDFSVNIGGIDADGNIGFGVSFAEQRTDLEFVFTIIDANGFTVDTDSVSFYFDDEGDYVTDGVVLKDRPIAGFRTLQVHVLDKESGSPLGALATMYNVRESRFGGLDVMSCYGREFDCIRSVYGFTMYNQAEYHPVWGWKVTHYDVPTLTYTGGSDWIPVCYYGDRIVCSEATLASVDARLGHDHARSLALLRAQLNEGGPIEVDMPDRIIPGEPANIPVTGEYVVATASLFFIEEEDGTLVPVAFDQTQLMRPLLSFKLPEDARKGTYELYVNVLDHDGELHQYTYDFLI